MSAEHRAREPRPFLLAKGRCFIDTNVLVYAHASDEPFKQSRALSLLGLLHAQVLQEFCNVALKKLSMNTLQVQAQLHFLKQLDVVMLTPDLMNQALDLHQQHRLSFYDAMIVSAAHASHCSTLYSEDFNPGEVLRGVKLVNPFSQLS